VIRLAKREAAKSKFYFRLGCIITKGNRVLSTGHNSISYCELNSFENSKHAEMDAVLKLLRRHDGGLSSLCGSTVYVTRITPQGNTALAKPCAKCMSLLISVGVKEVIYTTDNSNTERIKL
jgi:deoxycytidylate deaminase